MFKNIFRLTALGFLWNRYRLMIVSTLMLFLYFWVVAALHADFVEFSHLDNETEHLGTSFLLKWLAFILGFAVYITINSRDRKFKSAGSVQPEPKAKPEPIGQPEPIGSPNGSDIDPFDGIRNKEKLRSAADFVMESNKAVKRKTQK